MMSQWFHRTEIAVACIQLHTNNLSHDESFWLKIDDPFDKKCYRKRMAANSLVKRPPFPKIKCVYVTEWNNLHRCGEHTVKMTLLSAPTSARPCSINFYCAYSLSVSFRFTEKG